MKEKMMICGKRHFDATPVTVTDPSYSRGTWCSVENIGMPEGEYRLGLYTVRSWYADDEIKKHRYFTRVSRAFMILDSVDPKNYRKLHHEEIGEAGVDAGLCGFYQNKPNYNDDEWDEFCDEIGNRDYLIRPEGFCTSTGYGDGSYPVYKLKDDDGNVVGLELFYI